MVDIAAIARALPDVTEGVACAGTKLESRTFAVGKKSFLFVSASEMRLKLDASAAEDGVVVNVVTPPERRFALARVRRWFP